MAENRYDLIVIGGGPGGYVAAIRAAQLGMTTAVMEKEHLGGTCLNVGCIPTKTLFQSAEVANTVRESARYGIGSALTGVDFPAVMRRKDGVVKQLVNGVGYLLKKNKVDFLPGEAKLLSASEVKLGGKVYRTRNILIATGSSNAAPPIPGLKGERVIDSTQLLALKTLPKSMVIIGGGVIGCEFASMSAIRGWNRRLFLKRTARRALFRRSMCWCPPAARPTAPALAARSWASGWSGASSRWIPTCAPLSPASMRPATSRARACWHTPPLRAAWWPWRTWPA